MLSIIGDALLIATRARRAPHEPRDDRAGRFVPPSERRDENRRINVKRDLFW